MLETPQQAVTATTARYSLKLAAELSGLTLNQLRIWEQRSRLVAQDRSEKPAKGPRLYSQEDVELLRYAWRETQSGVNFQVVVDRIHREREAVLNTLRQGGTSVPRQIYSGDPRRLPNYDLMLHAITHGDHLKFERLLIQAQAGKNFAESLRSVDLAMLARIGEMTARKQIGIGSSHLATAIIRRRVLSHVQSLNLGEPAVILACAPTDYHELGLLGCLLELTQKMIPCLYLGPNVPVSDVQHYCDKLQPQAVLISLHAPLDEDATAELAEQLGHLNQRLPVGIGGFEAEQKQALYAEQQLTFFESIEAVLGWPVLGAVTA